MRVFKVDISEYFGLFVLFCLSYSLANFIATFFAMKKIILVLLYFALCFVIIWLVFYCLVMLAFAKKYKLAFFLCLLFSWMHFGYSIKFMKIMNCYIQNRNIESTQKYFNDSDRKIQIIALTLYAGVYDIEPVIRWFEDNYIKKNLPIDSDFHPLYESISTPNL